jgi:hypothetical protein
MTVVRVRGIQRFRHADSGIWYAYHRKTGVRITSEFGSAAFFQELSAPENGPKAKVAATGTLGMVIAKYKG